MTSTASLPAATPGGGPVVPEASTDRVVPKPVPESHTQNPRRYQLNQIKKRYSSQENTLQDRTTNVRFRLKPSDPDFPFDLDHLDCELQVPAAYPQKAPILRVKNKDIPRGFSVNIERGWDRLVKDQPGATLLALTNALDKNLEVFLSEQKAETVTLMSFRDTRHLDRPTTTVGGASPPTASPSPKPAPPSRKPFVPEASFTEEQIAGAKARRAQETRQLEARMGRMPIYQKSADGVVYTLPFEPRRRAELPAGLQSIKSVQLIVPLLYPLQALRVLLNDVTSEDAEALEEVFATKAAQQSQMTLTSHLNYLSQNIHTMARRAQEAQKQIETPAKPVNNAPADGTSDQKQPVSNVGDGGRSHIHYIARPPEWGVGSESEESDVSDDGSWDSESDSDGGAVVDSQTTGNVLGVAQQAERGTSISFPSIELHGIELLQVAILSVSVKCERCRALNDITGLKPEVEKVTSCKKCGTAFTARFRQEMVHQGSVRAGFIDVSGCTVADMLPSTFVPTCAKCSTPSQGLVSVRGEVITNVCRECHGKFTFKIPDVRFIAITHGSSLPPTTGPRRRQEKLGLHAGEPLPQRGACQHYRRSYRWFRFSCCSKVHACDKCHDAAEDHPQEWANRMICGWCSREQNYAVEACAFCGRSVIGRKGKGFWEGGKGTRDKTMMRRKDKRKFHRVGGGEAKKTNL
ncbi:hypothetical protein F4779DRAFT_621755 [Xylariaceae sp. FL0662B]|nr:hypothetical protein F4779DRAFT_621755 [Xylariaceae sp. FL0662B]